jgi:hypothetical protein
MSGSTKKFNLEANTDYPGSDMHASQFNVTVDQCKERCKNMDGCVLFGYDKPAQRCYLKFAKADWSRRNNNNVDSYVLDWIPPPQDSSGLPIYRKNWNIVQRGSEVGQGDDCRWQYNESEQRNRVPPEFRSIEPSLKPFEDFYNAAVADFNATVTNPPRSYTGTSTASTEEQCIQIANTVTEYNEKVRQYNIILQQKQQKIRDIVNHVVDNVFGALETFTIEGPAKWTWSDTTLGYPDLVMFSSRQIGCGGNYTAGVWISNNFRLDPVKLDRLKTTWTTRASNIPTFSNVQPQNITIACAFTDCTMRFDDANIKTTSIQIVQSCTSSATTSTTNVYTPPPPNQIGQSPPPVTSTTTTTSSPPEQEPDLLTINDSGKTVQDNEEQPPPQPKTTKYIILGIATLLTLLIVSVCTYLVSSSIAISAVIGFVLALIVGGVGFFVIYRS